MNKGSRALSIIAMGSLFLIILISSIILVTTDVETEGKDKCNDSCQQFGLLYSSNSHGGYASAECWCIAKDGLPRQVW